MIRRVPRKVAMDRFLAMAVKNGWKISKAGIDQLLKVRDGDGLLFFTSIRLSTTGKRMTLQIVDAGNFDKECEVAYENRHDYIDFGAKPIESGDLIAPRFGQGGKKDGPTAVGGQ